MLDFAPQLLQKLSESVRTRLSPQPIGAASRSRNRTLIYAKGKTAVSPQVLSSIESAQNYLFSLQKEEGYWEGHVYDNVTITAEYLMALKFLGLFDDDPELIKKAKKTILDTQLPDGGWNIYEGGPSEHSATVEAYFALKLCGLTGRHKAMRLAKDRILECGGIATTRVFTKIHLALFGQYSWNNVPVINPELMLLPKQAPIHIYEFSSWSRAVIIPLLIIFDQKPVMPLPKSQGIAELYVPGTRKRKRDQLKEIIKNRRVELEHIFEVAQTALTIYEKMPMKPLRKTAVAMAEEWILKHQDPEGNWGGIFPAMANSLIALRLRGYPFKHPVMSKGLKALRSFADETEKTFRMQSTISPVWDTAIAGYALSESGQSPDQISLKHMRDWLLKKQILNVYGDWRFKAKKARPGGWPFEHENDQYPDIDDSALAILALLPYDHDAAQSKKVTRSIDRGIEWLLGMQGSDGGWGAFDRDNNRHILNQIPFADLKSLLDPSTPDVTGHVIEALGAAGYKLSEKPMQRALEFLRKTQEKDGSWFGRWGVAYVYGTGAVLSGLQMAGVNMRANHVEKALRWLESIQNQDGGWGESCQAYDKNQYVPLGYSTVSQTSWALLGLLASPLSQPKIIEQGIQFLVDTQKPDGSWEEPEWTGTGFPRHFYLRYDYYRLYFPLLALGRFASAKCRNSFAKSSAMA